jgi:hypothetical protein
LYGVAAGFINKKAPASGGFKTLAVVGLVRLTENVFKYYYAAKFFRPLLVSYFKVEVSP